MNLSPPALIATAAIGACMGSYASTAALRMAQGRQSLSGRSRCDACGVGLSYAATLPIVSYVRLGGVCRGCQAPIDPAHLAGEIAGPVILLTALAVSSAPRTATLAALGLALLAAAVLSAKTGRLPTGLILAIGGVCALLALERSLNDLLIGAASAGAALVLLEGLRRLNSGFRGKALLAFSDVALTTAVAIWLGVLLLWALAVTAVIGGVAMIALRGKDRRLAPGPLIAIAAWGVGMVHEAARWPI